MPSRWGAGSGGGTPRVDAEAKGFVARSLLKVLSPKDGPSEAGQYDSSCVDRDSLTLLHPPEAEERKMQVYGTVARIRVKPGMESKLQAMSTEMESMSTPGFIANYVYRMDEDSNEYYLVVIFDSKESYFANANKPETDAQYREMLDLLESEPEWHDGEVVYSYVASGTGIR